MFEIILRMLESIHAMLSAASPTPGTYEDGSKVLDVCNQPIDAAILMVGYAHHFLFVETVGRPDQLHGLWTLLLAFAEGCAS